MKNNYVYTFLLLYSILIDRAHGACLFGFAFNWGGSGGGGGGDALQVISIQFCMVTVFTALSQFIPFSINLCLVKVLADPNS